MSINVRITVRDRLPGRNFLARADAPSYAFRSPSKTTTKVGLHFYKENSRVGMRAAR
jgi:hypothetical protein